MPEGRVQRAHFSQEILQQISDLPGTQDLVDLTIRADALALWKTSLQKGTLPARGKVQWPQEPFCSRLMEALSTLEMPRFTRCNPKLVEPLLKQILSMTHTFEERMLELEAEREQKRQQQQQQVMQQGQPASSSEGEGEAPGDKAGNDDEDGQDGAASASSEEVAPGGENQAGEADSDSTQELQVQLDSEELQSKASEGQPGRDEEEDEEEAAVEELAQTVAEEILEKWEEEMAPVMEHLEDAQQFLGNLDPLLDSPKGWDLSKSVWARSGWKELKELRQKLERLRELRDLVRSLGRGGGMGPLRRAPEEIYSSAFPQGVIRDPSSPEETSGLTRSGDLSRMLPSEAALLAVGWPRQSVEESEEEVVLRGNRAARLLHLARRAERQLLSYERCGWVDDQPARLTHRQEIRPAAELGPIIVCLDTSGSMNGARESVAKALVLECMRGAHRQQRNCLVYAFSGPGQVQELELSVDVPSLERLLDFLECSFSGGTDVDAPFERSLDRLEKAEWSQADILMVTDGEIRPPKARLLKRLEAAQEDLGLQVHGLLVGNDVTPAMEELCTHLHLFKSWNAVGRPRSVY